ncbi:hypothetical protein [Thermocatellispora tengchongensis]|uniref:hypothetical protein n=1 Tax=Thermocatellispora tengchongensis TaxID=1073253 RepID=UPI00363CAECF
MLESERANWWLMHIERLTLRLTSHASPKCAWSWVEGARLLFQMLDLARETHSLSAHEVGVRRIYLVAEMIERLGVVAADRELDIDTVAREGLSLIIWPRERVEWETADWQNRSIETMLTLRRARSVVTALSYLLPNIRDAELRGIMVDWMRLLPSLP